MTPGSRSRRIAVGTAVGMVAVLSGCHGVPIARMAPTPNRPQSILGSVGRAAFLPATVALDIPAELSPIDPSNSEGGKVTPVSAIGESSRTRADLANPPLVAEPLPPTPLLDEALVRARTRGDLNTGAEPTRADLVPPRLGSLAMTETLVPPTLPTAPGSVAVPASITVTPAAMLPPIAPPTATPDPRPVDPPAPPATAEELWRDGVRELVGLARSKQEQAGTSGVTSGSTEPWSLRARVLAWLAEPDIDPDFGGRDADGVRSVLRALEATASTESGKPTAGPARGDDVRAAVQTLEAKAPLELVELQLCTKVERFGDFTPFDSPARRAGELVLIYCEVDGVHHEPTANGFQSRLAGRLEIIPEGGGPAIALPLGTAEEVVPRRRRDYYWLYRKYLPTDLAPGRYTLRLTLKDVFADRSASRDMALTIIRAEENQPGVPSSPREATGNP